MKKPAAFLLDYRDGMQAVSYMLDGQVGAWSFAAKLKGTAEPISTYFTQGDESGSRPFPHFDALVHCAFFCQAALMKSRRSNGSLEGFGRIHPKSPIRRERWPKK